MVTAPSSTTSITLYSFWLIMQHANFRRPEVRSLQITFTNTCILENSLVRKMCVNNNIVVTPNTYNLLMGNHSPLTAFYSLGCESLLIIECVTGNTIQQKYQEALLCLFSSNKDFNISSQSKAKQRQELGCTLKSSLHFT